LQEALDSVKAEKRVVTINQPFKLSHKIEMVALRSSRLGTRKTQHGTGRGTAQETSATFIPLTTSQPKAFQLE
jgi:hypothetical protein